ncbi:hypothetical protein SOVF_120250 [Spinacia oleracea]|uniref:Small ribosomal subunit protein mS41 SAM domain-containing protein n=1 Tax=Spinacia oleracea TaxID=3562 RepID=A0A9R0HR38_SPIOL|nr:uncharacterized protein LOC110775073 [Spinacia oleracea]KNA13063.1 hypothetical protein SOVF_120250 [Spinacia oleracea]
MISIWRQISRTFTSPSTASIPAFAPPSSRFSSTSSPYLVKVGIPEFLRGIGNGVEAHVEKLESEFGDLQRLLVVRTLKLKKLEIPCKHRKLILKFAHKYRVGLWRPRSDMVKV